MPRPNSWPLPDRIGTAFLCAAVTSLAACRADPARAYEVNVTRTATLARTVLARGGRVAFLSSSLVFDGTAPHVRADAPPCPANEYGALKAEAEAALRALAGPVAILRVTKVVAPSLPLFRDWLADLRAGRPIAPFDDMVLAPVAPALVGATALAVAAQGADGIVQLGATRDITYAEAAGRLAQRFGVPGLVRPRSARAAGIDPGSIVGHTTLDTSRLAALGLSAPDPFAAIDSLAATFERVAAGAAP